MDEDRKSQDEFPPVGLTAEQFEKLVSRARLRAYQVGEVPSEGRSRTPASGPALAFWVNERRLSLAGRGREYLFAVRWEEKDLEQLDHLVPHYGPEETAVLELSRNSRANDLVRENQILRPALQEVRNLWHLVSHGTDRARATLERKLARVQRGIEQNRKRSFGPFQEQWLQDYDNYLLTRMFR